MTRCGAVALSIQAATRRQRSKDMHRINSRFLTFFLFSLLLSGLAATPGPVFAQSDAGLAA